ncbi:Kinesin-like protein [Vigna angularis]|uniref:Kinesin-like protein n=1 Tax=Phaseolus angularis TaxID=3914 RepID=A0A8T0JYR9_PHAAN|nr:Kinesin-like protein [Vigna angularis]
MVAWPFIPRARQSNTKEVSLRMDNLTGIMELNQQEGKLDQVPRMSVCSLTLRSVFLVPRVSVGSLTLRNSIALASMVSKQLDRVGGKVRVIARIRGFSGPEANLEPDTSRTVDWISVNDENLDDVSISFRDHPSRYLVDYCYKEDEDSEMIYSREVKPFVSAAFEGHNSTVIAHGARGSGKTHIIQGSAERPGLAVLAIAEFLPIAEKNGKSISVSFYEVDHQERAMDLLNPEKPPILVFEDRGRNQFKGLSQVPVKSVNEFQNLYSTACLSLKGAPKKGGQRSHMGLIVNVVSRNESVGSTVSKMNFVDLAGYEDTRKKSSDGSCLTEINKINKSIYALLNICHALRTNESHIPYRESKLTRILQDSLRGTSRILLVSCLNPSFCQDTIYMVSLASRSCHRIHHQTFLDSTKKSVSSANMRQIPKNVSGTAKKFHGSSKLTKGRKLFDEASHSTPKVEKEMVTKASKPLMDNSLPETGNHDNSGVETIVNTLALTNVSFPKDDLFAKASQDMKLYPPLENGDSSLNASSEVEINSLAAKDVLVDGDEGKKENTPCINHSSESMSIIVHEGHNSPPISSQLRDLSNSLKMLCSSTSSCLQNSEKQPIPAIEPKTPIIQQNMSQWDEMNGKSPWETFSMRGSGMKV